MKKNEFLLCEGEVCRDLVFLQAGRLRLYYIEDGVEISVWFSFQFSSAIEIYSFVSAIHQAIEDSEIFYL